MQSIIIDTHEFISILESYGFTKTQSEGIKTAMQKLDLTSLATKEDIGRLDSKINTLDVKIDKVELSLKKEIEMVKSELFKWGSAALFAQAALIVGLIKLMN